MSHESEGMSARAMNRAILWLRKLPYPVRVILLAAAYLGAAWLGLAFAFVQKNVTPVWPPTGIALAALLLFGYELWPGVIIGAFLANFTNSTPVVPSLIISAGNTAAALSGAYLFNRVARSDITFSRIWSVLVLVGLSAGLSALISASVGATTLCTARLQVWGRWVETWWVWWLGDAMGALVVAPVLLTWGASPLPRWNTGRMAEAGILLALTVAASFTIFSGPFRVAGYDVLAYLAFPFLIWAALRFEQRGVVALNLVIAGIAVWATAREAGPFARKIVHDSLFSLASYIGTAQIGAMLIAANLAERRQIEEELQRLNTDLEGRVRVRTAELNAANRRLAELDRLRSRLIADISHEMRTPLTIMNTDTYLLEHGQPDKHEGYLSELRRQIERLTEFADTAFSLSILDLDTRWKAATLGLVDLNGRVEQVIKTFAPAAEDLGLRLTFKPDPELPPIHARVGHIQQVITHLVINAISYTSKGEIAIRTGINSQRDRVFLEVSDTGRGIHPDDLPHIFERFYRGEEVGQTDIPGGGLGLAIVKGIVDLHGGSIEVQSDLDKGSTFRVWLPVAGAEYGVTSTEQ